MIYMKMLLTGLFALFISGCAPSLNKQNMGVPSNEVTLRVSKSSVGDIIVTGGSSVTGQIDSVSLKDAILQTLTNTKVFKVVSPKNSPDYTLHAEIISLEKPKIGFEIKSVLRVKYFILRASSNQLIWMDEFTSSYTATTGDSFFGPGRLTKANEGAVRENLRQLVTALSEQML